MCVNMVVMVCVVCEVMCVVYVLKDCVCLIVVLN